MSFTADLNRFINLTEQKMNLVYRVTALELFNRIVLRTPVGNPDLWKNPPGPNAERYVGGRLRANWQFTLGQPADGVKDTTNYSGNEGAVAAQLGTPGVNIHHVVYFTNNLPYAQAIEEGHSYRQAPQGMVKVTLSEYPRILQEAARAV